MADNVSARKARNRAERDPESVVFQSQCKQSWRVARGRSPWHIALYPFGTSISTTQRNMLDISKGGELYEGLSKVETYCFRPGHG